MSVATITKKHVLTTRIMASIAILGAVSAILMRIEFALPIAPSFYRIDVSEVAVLIGGFAYGPVAAILIELMKNLIYVMFGGTSTAFVGEIANFIMGCAFVLPPIFCYQRSKSKTSALLGLGLGIASLAISGALLNYYVLLPMYAVIYQMPLEAMIAMGTVLNPNVNSLFTFVLLMSVPFNLIKGCLVSSLVFISYKKISIILKGTK